MDAPFERSKPRQGTTPDNPVPPQEIAGSLASSALPPHPDRVTLRDLPSLQDLSNPGGGSPTANSAPHTDRRRRGSAALESLLSAVGEALEALSLETEFRTHLRSPPVQATATPSPHWRMNEFDFSIAIAPTQNEISFATLDGLPAAIVEPRTGRLAAVSFFSDCDRLFFRGVRREEADARCSTRALAAHRLHVKPICGRSHVCFEPGLSPAIPQDPWTVVDHESPCTVMAAGFEISVARTGRGLEVGLLPRHESRTLTELSVALIDPLHRILFQLRAAPELERSPEGTRRVAIRFLVPESVREPFEVVFFESPVVASTALPKKPRAE